MNSAFCPIEFELEEWHCLGDAFSRLRVSSEHCDLPRVWDRKGDRSAGPSAHSMSI